jgi:ketosteroid isomerase-like protein
MTEQRGPAELMRAYYAALDESELDRLDDLFTAESIWEFPGSSATGTTQIKRRLGGSVATGLRMTHTIGHMVAQGDVAICELAATNVLGEQSFVVTGAVVCEAREGRIARLCAYPNAATSVPFLAALAEAVRQQRA